MWKKFSLRVERSLLRSAAPRPPEKADSEAEPGEGASRTGASHLRNLLRLIHPRSRGLNDASINPDQTEHTATTTPPSPLRARLTGAIINVAVVLIDFSDKQFASAQTPAHFHSLWFGTGVNSVNDFFKNAANSEVPVTEEVVGPYRMPHSMATDAANLAKTHLAFSKESPKL